MSILSLTLSHATRTRARAKEIVEYAQRLGATNISILPRPSRFGFSIPFAAFSSSRKVIEVTTPRATAAALAYFMQTMAPEPDILIEEVELWVPLVLAASTDRVES